MTTAQSPSRRDRHTRSRGCSHSRSHNANKIQTSRTRRSRPTQTPTIGTAVLPTIGTVHDASRRAAAAPDDRAGLPRPTVTVRGDYSPPWPGRATCDVYTVGSAVGGHADPAIALLHQFQGNHGGDSAYYQFTYLTVDTLFDPAVTYHLTLPTDYDTCMRSTVTIGVAGVATNNAPNYTEWHWDQSTPVPAFCVHPSRAAKSANGTKLLSMTLAKADL